MKWFILKITNTNPIDHTKIYIQTLSYIKVTDFTDQINTQKVVIEVKQNTFENTR